jgi:uncharacterized membrane protein
MYDRVGKFALRFTVAYLWRRYRSKIRSGIALTVGATAAAVYLANRNVPEG